MSDDRQLAYEPPHRVVPAWAFSVVFHAVMLTVIGWTMQLPERGTTTEVDRPVGLAVVERLPDRDRYLPAEEQREPAQAVAETSPQPTDPVTAASLAPANIAAPIDLDGMLAEMTAGDVPSVMSAESTGAFAEGTGTSGAGSRPVLDGEPTTAMLFGITGSGSRFVYVFDRSDSMNGSGGKPLRAAKAELKKSLQSLSENQQFQIIFYNDEPRPFMPAGTGLSLLLGEASMVRRAVSYIDAVKAFGGTEHFEALRMALRMGPDVVFFLTDARVPRLNASQFADIRRLAERSGTSIHAIEFGAESQTPEDSFLRQLAAENRGDYRYIALDQLSATPFSQPPPPAAAPVVPEQTP
ncbi:MAG: VWA domain-containing protein [Planctomycetaceae bacterium]